MASGFSWKPSDVSTFAQQSQNLEKQAGGEGLQTGQQKAQQQTTQKTQQVAQTAQNIGQGAQQVVQGANAQPVIAYNLSTANQSGTTINKYGISAPPDVTVAGHANLTIPTAAPTPQVSVPAFTPSQLDLSNIINQTNQGNFADTYNQALGQIQNQGASDQAEYQNQVQNAFDAQKQAYDTQLGNQQQALNQFQTQTAQNIGNWGDTANAALQNYQNQTQNLTNQGQQSAAEQQSANLNAALANGGPNSNAQALAALTNGNIAANSRLAALGQQAQNADIQKAIAQAQLNQTGSQIAQDQLQNATQNEAQGFTNAGNYVTNEQQTLNDQLQQNVQETQNQIQAAHDQALSYLNTQEQQAISHISDGLQNVAPQRIQSAAEQFSNLTNKYVENNKTNVQGLQNILKSYLQIYSATLQAQSPAFANQIASTFQPTIAKINSYLADLNKPRPASPVDQTAINATAIGNRGAGRNSGGGSAANAGSRGGGWGNFNAGGGTFA